jgi:protein-tyrosine phosphatase
MENHIPRAINIPIHHKDSFEAITKNISIAKQMFTTNDKRRWNLRTRITIVLYCGSDDDTNCRLMYRYLQHKNENYYPPLQVDGHVFACTYILTGGFQRFEWLYPFLRCSFHNHHSAASTDDDEADEEVSLNSPSTEMLNSNSFFDLTSPDTHSVQLETNINLSSSESALSSSLQNVHNHRAPFPHSPTEVIPQFLYLGSCVDAKDRKMLAHLQVKHIINLSSEMSTSKFHESYEDNVFLCEDYRIPNGADSKIFELFEPLCQKLALYELKHERVLVHCFHGLSRSATLVIAYLMHSRSWTLHSSYRYTKYLRNVIFPHPGFWRQLATWELKIWNDLQAPLKSVNSWGNITHSGSDTDDVESESPSKFTSSLAECVDIEELEREMNVMGAILSPTESQCSDDEYNVSITPGSIN